MLTSTFAAFAARITNLVEFKPEFANGTGYFDGAVTHDFGLQDGESSGLVEQRCVHRFACRSDLR